MKQNRAAENRMISHLLLRTDIQLKCYFPAVYFSARFKPADTSVRGRKMILVAKKSRLLTFTERTRMTVPNSEQN